jgi:hypothetical protein
LLYTQAYIPWWFLLNSRIWKEMKKGGEGELEGRAKEEVEPGESALQLRREIVLLT